MKYSQIAPEETVKVKDPKITKTWERESHDQPGMILEVVQLEKNDFLKERVS